MTAELPKVPFTTVHANLVAHLEILKYNGDLWDNVDRREWEETHRKLIDGHGTRTRYQSKRDRCRCPLCKKAQSVQNSKRDWSQYKREHRARARAMKLQMLADLEDDDEL